MMAGRGTDFFDRYCPDFCSQPPEGKLRRIGIVLLFFWINATDVWAASAGSVFGFLFLYLCILSSRKAAEATG